MARTDFVAIVCAEGAEYAARNELGRLGWHPYLPQQWVPWVSPGGARLVRLVARFSRVVLLPVVEVDLPVLRAVHCLRHPWVAGFRIPAAVVDRLLEAELRGDFDAGLPRQYESAGAGCVVAQRGAERFGGGDLEPVVRRLAGAAT
jgi:hypothetical protein